MVNTQKMICEAFGYENILKLDYHVYKTKITEIDISSISSNEIEKISKNKSKKVKIKCDAKITLERVLYSFNELESPIKNNTFNPKDKSVKSIDNIQTETNELELSLEEAKLLLDEISSKSNGFKLYDYDDKPLFSSQEIKKVKIVNENNTPCALCGDIHPVGYIANNEEELLKTLISDTYNECYSIKANNFICEYCGYSLKAYGSPSKSAYGKKMINVLVHDGKAIEKSFNSDAKNELYDILVNPPKPPFVILINSRGTVLENLVFTAKATISKGLIVVNYGLNNLEVNPDEIFNAIEDAKEIAAKYEIETNSDSIWNRADEVSIKVKEKNKKGLINLNDFYNDMGLFIGKYNRDCRLVAKMILEAYLKNHKPNLKVEVDTKEVSNPVQTSLFDF